MGIKCLASRKLLTGSHTGKSCRTEALCFLAILTGLGQLQVENLLKNARNSSDGVASGFFWDTQQTKIAQLTPPKKPSTLLYSPWTRAHSFTARRVSRKFSSWVGLLPTVDSRYCATLTPLMLRMEGSSNPRRSVSSTSTSGIASISSTTSSSSGDCASSFVAVLFT